MVNKVSKKKKDRKLFPVLDLKSDKDIAMDFSVKVYRQFDKIVKAIVLFGSSAKNSATPNSDIDLIIISEDFYGKRSFERPVGLYRLWWNRADKKEIDIICLTPEEFEIMKKRIGAIRDAAREGIEI